MAILEKQFGKRFENVSCLSIVVHLKTEVVPKIVSRDDYLPMYIEKANERDSVLDIVWLNRDERDYLARCVIGIFTYRWR